MTTDSTGRYTITQLPAGYIAVVHAGSAEYFQLCAAGLQLGAGAPELDVEIASSVHPPPSPTRRPLIISGQIYETTSAGRVAIVDASVGVDWQVDSPLYGGAVFTDADGRYSLCGIPRGWMIEFVAYKPGYDYTDAWQRFNTDTTFDIELKRLN